MERGAGGAAPDSIEAHTARRVADAQAVRPRGAGTVLDEPGLAPR